MNYHIRATNWLNQVVRDGGVLTTTADGIKVVTKSVHSMFNMEFEITESGYLYSRRVDEHGRVHNVYQMEQNGSWTEI